MVENSLFPKKGWIWKVRPGPSWPRLCSFERKFSSLSESPYLRTGNHRDFAENEWKEGSFGNFQLFFQNFLIFSRTWMVFLRQDQTHWKENCSIYQKNLRPTPRKSLLYMKILEEMIFLGILSYFSKSPFFLEYQFIREVQSG